MPKGLLTEKNMNTDTGEIRRMTKEEMAELNRIAGKEQWVPITEHQARIAEQIGGSSRNERRRDFRKAHGFSRFEAKLRGLVR